MGNIDPKPFVSLLCKITRLYMYPANDGFNFGKQNTYHPQPNIILVDSTRQWTLVAFKVNC